jgi:hypothetical protein
MDIALVSWRAWQDSRRVVLCVLQTPEAITAPGKRAPSSFVQLISARGQCVCVLFSWRVRRTSRADWTPRIPSYLRRRQISALDTCLTVRLGVVAFTFHLLVGYPCDFPYRLAPGL